MFIHFCEAYGDFAINFTFSFTSVYIPVIWSDGVFEPKKLETSNTYTICHLAFHLNYL